MQKKSEQIWEKIKDRNVELFGFSHKKVSDYCQFVDLAPDKCFLWFKVSAFLPALETVLNKEYTVELIDNYIVVSNKDPYAV